MKPTRRWMRWMIVASLEEASRPKSRRERRRPLAA